MWEEFGVARHALHASAVHTGEPAGARDGTVGKAGGCGDARLGRPAEDRGRWQANPESARIRTFPESTRWPMTGSRGDWRRMHLGEGGCTGNGCATTRLLCDEQLQRGSALGLPRPARIPETE